jgi:hypothetical protein
MYARARIEQAEAVADKVMEVAEDVLSGAIAPDQGRVAIDAFKWTAAKLDRATYGDTPASTTIHNTVAVQVMPEERRQRIMELRRQAVLPDHETDPLLPREV